MSFIKINEQLKLKLNFVSPTIFYWFIILVSLYFFPYTDLRPYIFFSGIIYQFLFIQKDVDEPPIGAMTIGFKHKVGNEKTNKRPINRKAAMLFDWSFAIYLSVDVLFFSFSGYTGFYLLYFIFWGLPCYVELEQYLGNTDGFFLSNYFKYLIVVSSSLGALTALSAIFFGNYSYTFLSIFF